MLTSLAGSSFSGYDAAKKTALAHSAWHAQVFPAAFGLVPEARWPKILAFLQKKGMAGSVYAAYWVLKAACVHNRRLRARVLYV